MRCFSFSPLLRVDVPARPSKWMSVLASMQCNIQLYNATVFRIARLPHFMYALTAVIG